MLLLGEGWDSDLTSKADEDVGGNEDPNGNGRDAIRRADAAEEAAAARAKSDELDAEDGIGIGGRGRAECGVCSIEGAMEG